MTLSELRALSDSVRRIPCAPLGEVPVWVREFNASVTRFQELVVLVRNRIVMGEPGGIPAGADQVRRQAASLAARRPGDLPGWMTEPAEPAAPGPDRLDLAR